MSKDEKISKLSRENLVFQKKVTQLEFENEQLKRLIFGSKTERFVANEIADNQGSLFAEDAENPEEKEKNVTEKISYERKKANPSRENHSGRNKIPEHLP